MTSTTSPAATIAAHVDQLRASERGRQTLADLHHLLNNGGGGLDFNNQRALAGLLSSAFRGSCGSVLDATRPFTK